MKRCAILTLKDRSGYFIYDSLLFEPLAQQGWQAEEIPWNQPGVNWRDYDAVIIRSTWDYQKAPEQFLQTLEEIQAQTRLFNSVEICRWNMHKDYLRELQQQGVRIIPTQWLPALTANAVETALAEFHSETLVAKPLIGANADNAFVLRANDHTGWQNALACYADTELMLQPFIQSIKTEGEISLFYFGGIYSHAIRKRPAAGDFRVQEEHGGSLESIEPENDTLELAEQTLQAINQTLLYARVDIVRLDNGLPALIELELIEPSLYFEHDKAAAERFVMNFLRMRGSG